MKIIISEDQIKKIVKRVIEELSKIEKEDNRNKKKILCIGFNSWDREMLKPYYEKYNLELKYTIDAIRDYDELWIGRLSIEDMAAMSTGLKASIGSPIQFLINARPVKIHTKGLQSRSNRLKISPTMKSMWNNYEKILEKMGYEFVDFNIYEKEIKEQSKQKRASTNRRLITEKIIKEKIEKGEEIIFRKNDLITPLAKDYLKEKNILWRWERD